MPRPRTTKPERGETSDAGAGQPVSALDELRTIIGENDLPAGVPEALLALAQAIDRSDGAHDDDDDVLLENLHGLTHRVERLEAVEHPTVELVEDGPGQSVLDNRFAELEDRVREVESRISEAGRRMIWLGENPSPRHSHPARYMPEIGRVLVFDPETPNPDGEPTAQTSGTVETTTLGPHPGPNHNA